ncbi:MAG TPA: hypothetical protein VF295_00180 [Candidatus Limnocylindria bacterium]
MATTTETGIVPDKGKRGHRRKPLSKAQKAKLAASLAKWRASLTDEDRAALSERMRQQNKARWDAMSKKEKAAALAGVKAWQAEQRAAKAAKAKPAPKARANAKARKAAPLEEIGESAAPKRTRKAAAK